MAESGASRPKLAWDKNAAFALKFNKFILWPLGLWPSDCDSLFSIGRTVFALISQVWLIYVELMAAYLRCGGASDIVDFVMLSVCAVMALSKIIAIRVHMAKVRGLFFSALDDWLGVEEAKTREILLPFAKSARFVFRLQMISCYLANTLIILGSLPFLAPPSSPANETWSNASESLAPSRELPLKTGCMFARCRDELYGFLYFYESVTINISAHGNVGCDVFLFCLAMHLCGQIEALKGDILEIGAEKDSQAGPKKTRTQLAKFVGRHCRLLDLAEALNETVSGMLLVQLVLNAGMNLLLGIRIILAIKSGLIFDALRPLIGFNVLMLQLYLLSYASDRLSSQAESVLDAIYDGSWYELPAAIRRDLCFVAMRSNRPIYLMAAKFYELNIENFKNLLKASFSYFSILRVMFDG